MNKVKRDLLKDAKALLGKASDIVSRVIEEEEDCLENMPENLQASEKYERMEDAINKLESAIDHIENAQEDIEEASA